MDDECKEVEPGTEAGIRTTVICTGTCGTPTEEGNSSGRSYSWRKYIQRIANR